MAQSTLADPGEPLDETALARYSNPPSPVTGLEAERRASVAAVDAWREESGAIIVAELRSSMEALREENRRLLAAASEADASLQTAEANGSALRAGLEGSMGLLKFLIASENRIEVALVASMPRKAWLYGVFGVTMLITKTVGIYLIIGLVESFIGNLRWPCSLCPCR
mgnify:CR=1 FL=1